jgi:hypothetical protein
VTLSIFSRGARPINGKCHHFGGNPDGAIDQVKMQAVSPTTDFSFDFQDLLLRPKQTTRR